MTNDVNTSEEPLIWQSLVWGFISAFSLNVGSAIGIRCLPRAWIRAVFMSFGGGSLLFALAIELFGHALHLNETGECESCIYFMEVFAVFGGALFMFINWCLATGAYTRGAFSGCSSICSKSVRQAEEDEKINAVVPFSPEASIARRDCDFVADSKSASPQTTQSTSHTDEDKDLSIVSPEEMHVTEEGRPLNIWPAPTAVDEADQAVANKLVPPVAVGSTSLAVAPGAWANSAWSDNGMETEVRKTSKVSVHSAFSSRLSRLAELSSCHEPVDHMHAATMVWLGILLDAIPESVVIGILVNDANGSAQAILPFVIGVFLSNLPESMSAAGTMDVCGMPVWKNTLLWAIVTVVTSIGAVVGAVAFPPGTSSDPAAACAISAIEGLAAGAMLTMIAQTMMPEAHEQGGNVVGLSCLAGFLCALTVKVLPFYDD